MNTQTLQAAQQTFATDQESLPHTVRSSTTQKVTFLLVWAAVALPLVWGVLKACDEIKLMF